jgi:hypothetical protein
MSRRRFFKSAAAAAGAVIVAPTIVSAAALGKDGAVAASDRITLGAIGIGHRGSYDLGCILWEPDVQVVAVADVRGVNRKRAKETVDNKYSSQDCKPYIDFRELLARPDIDAVLIATGPNWHATASIAAAKAGKDVYCEKPSTKNIVQSLNLADTFRRTARVFQCGTQRRNLPNFMFAIKLAQDGKLGKLKEVHAQPAGMKTSMSGWLPAESEPAREEVDWDMYLGPAAWRPYNKQMLNGFNFEKGGGMVGGGVLEWGSHCVDLCQWANSADDTSPVEYFPAENGEATAMYGNGVKLVLRDHGWMKSGSCPVKFVGTTGWVETGDSGDIFASSPDLLVGKGASIKGYPANNHIRDFFRCVKTRGQPLANADVACHSHITCHCANISLFLNRKLKFDPATSYFVGDDQANRLRSEALRDPWRL